MKIRDAGKLRKRGRIVENWNPRAPCIWIIRIPLFTPFIGITSERISRGRRSTPEKAQHHVTEADRMQQVLDR